jgi:hypothetical protein
MSTTNNNNTTTIECYWLCHKKATIKLYDPMLEGTGKPFIYLCNKCHYYRDPHKVIKYEVINDDDDLP